MKTSTPMTKSPRAVAQEALRLAKDALPAHSSAKSRKDFTTHQLFAVLALNTFFKTDYRGKLAQAVNLGELRKQKLQVEEYVTQLEKQLPGKAEMDALLTSQGLDTGTVAERMAALHKDPRFL